MNVETCGHVADLTVMTHAFAELRDGVVARQHENGFKYGHNFAQTLYKRATHPRHSANPADKSQLLLSD